MNREFLNQAKKNIKRGQSILTNHASFIKAEEERFATLLDERVREMYASLLANKLHRTIS